jgi:hypothetical protein
MFEHLVDVIILLLLFYTAKMETTVTGFNICKYLHHVSILLLSFLGSTAQLRPWPPPQNPAEFLGGFSTFFFFTG